MAAELASGDLGSADAISPRVGIQSKRSRKLWPWIATAAIVLAILVASIVGFETGAILGRSVENRLTSAIAEADQDDPNWRLDDLMANREQVPDGENASLVMQEVNRLLPNGWLTNTKQANDEQQGRLDRVKEAFDALQATPENVRLSESVASSLRAELKTIDRAVSLARSLEGFRRGRHELELGPTLLDTPLAQTQDSRVVARLLDIDAAMRAHQGDLDGGLDSCRAILGAGRSIGDEPFAISMLVRIAINSVSLRSVRRVLGQGVPSDAALARLQSALGDELAQPLLVKCFRGERALLSELIRRIADGELPISALSSGPLESDRPFLNPSETPWGELWFDNQLAVCLDWMNKAVAIARMPAPEQPAGWDEWNSNFDRVRKSRFGMYTATLPILFMPALPSAGTAFSRYQSELGATLILIAAERHRRKVGDWPVSIVDIDRSILPIAPIDPYSGRAYRMDRRAGKLLIYSIGPDGKDEHGEYNPKLWPNGGKDDVGAYAWDVVERRRSPSENQSP